MERAAARPTTSSFAQYVAHPELAALLPVLYPGVFPNLAALDAAGTARADLLAILLTGIPSGIIPGFQNNTGDVQADMLRLNTAISPSANPNNLGLLGGDLAGFPNGRRVADDVVTIELRAIAGVTYALVATYTPDAAAGVVTDFTPPVPGFPAYLANFPYLRRALQRLQRRVLTSHTHHGMATPGRSATATVPASPCIAIHRQNEGTVSEHNYGPSPVGSVVLNLGENIGALILEADASVLGVEIEISPVEDDGRHSRQDHPHHRTHSMVRERHTLPHPRYDAVYPDLAAGRYTIWRDAETPGGTVTIVGGQITTHTLAPTTDGRLGSRHPHEHSQRTGETNPC